MKTETRIIKAMELCGGCEETAEEAFKKNKMCSDCPIIKLAEALGWKRKK